MSINRILLHRAIEEAEGYTELGMMEHALRSLQRRGALVHGNGRACYMLGEALRELGVRRSAAAAGAKCRPDARRHPRRSWRSAGATSGRPARQGDRRPGTGRAVDSSEAVLHYNLACYWSLARNRTLALKFLSQALEIDSNFRDLIADESDFNPLRHDQTSAPHRRRWR